MAVDTESLGLLGFPFLEKGRQLPKISLPPGADLIVQPSEADFEKAKAILVQRKRAAPDFKDPGIQRRNTFLSKRKVEARADPNNWKFSLHIIGQTLNALFDPQQATWQSIGIAKALFAAAGGGMDAQTLWQHAQDASLELKTGRIMKKLHNLTSDSVQAARCPWLEYAALRKDIPAVVFLCQAGLRQDSLDKALKLALTNKSYAVAEEILRFGAQIPKQRELYDQAMNGPQAPDLPFLMLWMASPLAGTRAFALDAMLTAAAAKKQQSDDMNVALSVLLANIAIEPAEAYSILLKAVKASNLQAMALISLAIDMNWSNMNGDGVAATTTAASISSSSTRLRILSFLFIHGAKADTPVLRKLLLKDAMKERLDHVRLLSQSGVSPCSPGPDCDTLQWAVANAKLEILDLILIATIPQDVASAAILHIPNDTSEADKIAIVTRLHQKKGASGEPLSRLLIEAVIQDSHTLITTLLTFGARADFVDEKGQNTLFVAIQRGNVSLARRLCSTKPSKTIVSQGVPLALEALGGEDQLETLCELLSLLVANGASGAPLEQAVLSVIPTKTWDPVLQRLLPVGMSAAAWGQAVEKAVKVRSPALLHLICKEAPTIPTRSLEVTLTDVIHGDFYHPKKARYLAAQAQKQAHWTFLNQLLVGTGDGAAARRKEVIEILLSHGASVSAGKGTVLVESTLAADIDHIRELLRWKPDEVALTFALKAALTLSNPDRISIVRILDGHGLRPDTRASHFLEATEKRDPELLSVLIGQEVILWEHDRGSLQFAVSQGLIDEVAILLRNGAPHSHVEASFETVLTHKLYRQRNNLQIAEKLLERQLSNAILNNALVRAFQESSSGLPADFIHLLLRYDVDVDVEQGICFVIAALGKNVHVFKSLAACRFSLTVVLYAFLKLEAFVTMREPELIEWINLLAAESQGEKLEGLDDDTIAISAMTRFPKGQALIACLLDIGYSRKKNRSSPLIWALSHNEVSDEVILELLSRGNYVGWSLMSEDSSKSPIHLAALGGRSQILQRLINMGAKFDVESSDGWTPLYLATSQGDTASMKVLLDAKSNPNDGSMHVAARSAHPECVDLLQRYGHDLQGSRDTLGGRSPLAELCFSGSGSGKIWERYVQETMKRFVPSMDHKAKFQGKTVLHLAIDNPRAAVPLLQSFLRVSKVAKLASKDEDYLFHDTNTDLYYSPDMYVRHLCRGKPAAEKQQLIGLLEAQTFKSRYYTQFDKNQPPGACGFPPDLERLLEEKRLAEWQLAEENRRREEMHRQELQRAEERARREIQLAQMKADFEVRQLETTQRMEQSHNRAVAAQLLESQRQQGELATQMELSRMQSLNGEQGRYRSEQRRLELQHNESIAAQQHRASEVQRASERRALMQRQDDEYSHAQNITRLQANVLQLQQRQQQRQLTYPGMDAATDAWKSDDEVD